MQNPFYLEVALHMLASVPIIKGSKRPRHHICEANNIFSNLQYSSNTIIMHLPVCLRAWSDEDIVATDIAAGLFLNLYKHKGSG